MKKSRSGKKKQKVKSVASGAASVHIGDVRGGNKAYTASVSLTEVQVPVMQDPVWICPATESMDLSSAIALALSQTSQLPLGNDTSHHVIGSTCRVYWDDEREWFTARVLLYDRGNGRHFIHYDEVSDSGSD
jgi:hypothetical protein